MFDAKLGYDPASPKSIEQYAIQLKDKTFMDVVLEKGNVASDAVEAFTTILDTLLISLVVSSVNSV